VLPGDEVMDASSTANAAGDPAMPRPRRQRWRGSLLVRCLTGAVLVAALAVASFVATSRTSPGGGQGLIANPEAPAPLTAAIDSLTDPDRCLRAADADAAVYDKLRSLRMTGWTTTRDPGVRDDTCVAPYVDTSVNHVVLVRTERPETREALSAFAERSYRDCLTQAQAMDAVSAILDKFHETAWTLRTDGPVGGPLDRLDAIVEHVRKGCWIYSGTGSTADGQRLYYIAGPS
jgi:hypothetical protein